jgi:hypothetical protein
MRLSGMSRVAHLQGSLASGLRNGLMRARSSSVSLRRLESILGHRT